MSKAEPVHDIPVVLLQSNETYKTRTALRRGFGSTDAKGKDAIYTKSKSDETSRRLECNVTARTYIITHVNTGY